MLGQYSGISFQRLKERQLFFVFWKQLGSLVLRDVDDLLTDLVAQVDTRGEVMLFVELNQEDTLFKQLLEYFDCFSFDFFHSGISILLAIQINSDCLLSHVVDDFLLVFQEVEKNLLTI
jgi:hypothetical protein